METLIVTTDFSESATNAARYAAYLSGPLAIKTIILYHSYDDAPKGSEVPLPAPEDTQLTHEKSLMALQNTASQLTSLIGAHTTIEQIADDLPLVAGIQRVVEKWKAGLVVVGITGKSNMEKFLVGSNTVAIADTCTAPVLVVPPEVEFNPIKKAVFACDFKKVDHTTPVKTIAHIVNKLGTELLVLNIEKPDTRFDPDIIPEQYKLHEILDELHPEFHYIEHKHIAEGIMDFAETQGATLVMTIPKNHDFFDKLFHRSVSRKLAHHTRLPLLILRNE